MIDRAQFKQALLRMPHFIDLPADTQQALAAAAIHRHYNGNQVLYVEGEPAEAIYLLEKGWVKATRMTPEGREQAMMFLRPVDMFGDIAALTGVPYPGTVTALEDVSVWIIPAQIVLELLQRQPAFALCIIRHLAERVLHYINLVEDLSLRSVESRLARTLLFHAELEDEQLIIPRREWTTFDQMAVRLGTVRDVLSRALKTLEMEKLIKVEKHRIVLIDPKSLAVRADH